MELKAEKCIMGSNFTLLTNWLFDIRAHTNLSKLSLGHL